VLHHLLRAPASRQASAPQPQTPEISAHVPAGGYFARVGQWLRENF